MSWDYGLANQTAEDYNDAVANGFCHMCIARKPDVKGQPCWQCKQEAEEE